MLELVEATVDEAAVDEAELLVGALTAPSPELYMSKRLGPPPMKVESAYIPLRKNQR